MQHRRSTLNSGTTCTDALIATLVVSASLRPKQEFKQLRRLTGQHQRPHLPQDPHIQDTARLQHLILSPSTAAMAVHPKHQRLLRPSPHPPLLKDLAMQIYRRIKRFVTSASCTPA